MFIYIYILYVFMYTYIYIFYLLPDREPIESNLETELFLGVCRAKGILAHECVWGGGERPERRAGWGG